MRARFIWIFCFSCLLATGVHANTEPPTESCAQRLQKTASRTIDAVCWATSLVAYPAVAAARGTSLALECSVAAIKSRSLRGAAAPIKKARSLSPSRLVLSHLVPLALWFAAHYWVDTTSVTFEEMNHATQPALSQGASIVILNGFPEGQATSYQPTNSQMALESKGYQVELRTIESIDPELYVNSLENQVQASGKKISLIDIYSHGESSHLATGKSGTVSSYQLDRIGELLAKDNRYERLLSPGAVIRLMVCGNSHGWDELASTLGASHHLKELGGSVYFVNGPMVLDPMDRFADMMGLPNPPAEVRWFNGALRFAMPLGRLASNFGDSMAIVDKNIEIEKEAPQGVLERARRAVHEMELHPTQIIRLSYRGDNIEKHALHIHWTL